MRGGKAAYSFLLHRHECFTGKYSTRKSFAKSHPGSEWRIFHILTNENIDEVISRVFTVVSANNQFVFIIKRKLHGGLRI